MLMNLKLVFVILCNLVRLGWTAEGEATADMPTVMEAIVHAMIDFRKEILDNLQLSLEYHTEQLEEIKAYVEHKMEEQEKRIKEVGKIVNVTADAMEHKMEEQEKRIKEVGKIVNVTANAMEHKMEEQEKRIKEVEKIVNVTADAMEHKMEEQEKRMKNKNELNFKEILSKFQQFEKTVDTINLRTLHGGSWTVFQRRIDGSVGFYHNWTMYKHGFGDINGEHWLGLEQLHIMTSSGRHELLVLLEDFEGNSTYALYDEFKIASEEEKYKLTVGKYSGTAGDSLTYHNGMEFSTFDQDHDESIDNLARYWKGAWWFGVGWESHLNGLYFLKGNHKQRGVGWDSFRYKYSLKSATMMFRSRASN